MAIVIRSLFQAKCEDRRQGAATASDPLKWVRTALPSQVRCENFHFFVDWSVGGGRLVGPLWLTRLLTAESPSELEQLSDSAVAEAFVSARGVAALASLSDVASALGLRAEAMLLGEPATGKVTERTPSWRLCRDGQDSVTAERLELHDLSKLIERIRGGQASLGSKGLIYGTSAIECWLSKSPNIFPGDCDALLVDNGVPRAIMEMKKHTLSGPIASNLASRYYPSPDGRKYDSLFALQASCEAATQSEVPVIMVYFATRYPGLRVQSIRRSHAQLEVQNDTGDLNIAHLDQGDIGNRILEAALQ